MPAILLPENEKLWLDKEIKADEAVQLIIPYPAEYMNAYEVSEKVNNVRANDPSLILPVNSSSKVTQTSLF